METPAKPPLELPPAVQDELVELLEACHALRDLGRRRDVVVRLDGDIGTRIAEHPAMRPHVTAMVKTCAAFPDGLRQLRDAVRWYEGNTAAMAKVDALLARQGVALDADSMPALPVGHIPEPAPLPPGSRMPYAFNKLFVGREQALRVLAETLGAHHTAAIGQVAAATGLGGIGKTQLVAAFVHRYGQYFEGGVFWLSFGDPASVSAEVATCGGPGHLGAWQPASAPDLATQVAMVRAAWAERVPRLLVFDNCEDEALLDEWRPTTGGCRVLVTSRRRDFSPHLGVHALPLDVLERAESLALMRSFLPGVAAGDDEVLDAICAELGDLPLALHLAGGFLARYRTAVTPAAYLTQLRDRGLLDHPSLQGRGSNTSPTGHALHVGRTVALSWERLDPEDEVDAMARALLQRAACLAPGEPIPRDLLVATLEVSEVDPDAALLVEDALGRVVDLALLDVSEPGEYTMHRLVRAFVQQSGGEDADAQAAVEGALIDEAYRLSETGFPAHFLPLLPHLRLVTDAAMSREDGRAALLANELGNHFRGQGEYGSARPLYERALAICEKQLGTEHPYVATSLNNLAMLLYAQGEYGSARPLYERALAIYEKQPDAEHPYLAASLNNLAMLLHVQGAYGSARPLYERALAIYEKQLGAEHPDVATSLNNLAMLLYAQGEYGSARPLHERALAIKEKRLGAEHPDIALSLNNLAMLLQAQGEYGSARPLYERALAIREKQLGAEHPDVALSLNDLAMLLQAQGEDGAARPLYERALAIMEAKLGPDHPHTRIVRDNLQSLPE